ncbi:hypothetical protein HY485_04570 [Candidatus Woesearchaeota archaeon]|nr:hypothetical protein [Candidatus Woesearchaeota archaeon]
MPQNAFNEYCVDFLVYCSWAYDKEAADKELERIAVEESKCVSQRWESWWKSVKNVSRVAKAVLEEYKEQRYRDDRRMTWNYEMIQKVLVNESADEVVFKYVTFPDEKTDLELHFI